MENDAKESLDDGSKVLEKIEKDEQMVTTAEEAVAVLKVKSNLRAGGLRASNKEWQE